MNKIIISIYIFQKRLWEVKEHLEDRTLVTGRYVPPSSTFLIYLGKHCTPIPHPPDVFGKTLQLVYLSDFVTIISPNQFQSQQIKFSSGATIFNLFS